MSKSKNSKTALAHHITEFPGCEESHSDRPPDPECDDCCARYKVKTGDLRTRKGLLSHQMLKNRWKPQQSGNPCGRRPGSRTMEEIATQHLDLPTDVDPIGNPVTYREAIVAGVIEAAMPPHQERWAVELLLARGWPEVKQIDADIHHDRLQIVVDDGERYLVGPGFDPRRPTVVFDEQDMRA